MRDKRYDIFFESIKIGPVTAKNRFYQVPHCTGTRLTTPSNSGWFAGNKRPKAVGQSSIRNNCSVHPSSDVPPHPSATLWDERDIKAHALMTEKVHRHGALACVDLCLGGARMANLETRETSIKCCQSAKSCGQSIPDTPNGFA